MKAFARKILLFCFLLIAIFVGLSLLPYADGFVRNYYHAHIDKLSHLEKTQNDSAKRIVFIGGSSLTFGLDSKQIADSLGLKVYNTTVHGGLGVDYSIDVLKKLLNPEKDIIVVGYEFPFTEDPSFYTEARIVVDYLVGRSLLAQLWNNPKKLRTLTMYTKLLITNLIYLTNPYKTGFNEIYRRDGFNEYGDLTSHLKFESKASLGDSVLITEPSKEYANLIKTALNDFQFFVISPPMRPCDGRYQTEALDNFDNFMYKNFDSHYILNTTEARIKNHYYFELPYHLNAEGRQIHSLKIVRALRKVL